MMKNLTQLVKEIKFFFMLEGKVREKNGLTFEMSRLKNLQRKLRTDIKKYKLRSDPLLSFNATPLSEVEKDLLLANFDQRIQQNTWIMKKIMNKVKKVYC